MKIGLIGYGTIGREVASGILDGRAGRAILVALLEVDADKLALARAEKVAPTITADADEFFNADTEVIVEAAGHAALKLNAERALRSGRDMLAVSAGALSDQEFLSTIKRAAEECNRRFAIPSGSLAGLDAVSAGAIGEIETVTLTARKPPAAFKGTIAEKQAADSTDQPVCLYDGPAREAAKLFPQNVNVVASLSLAGIGFDRTTIKMYADPTIVHNTFELSARGEFGEVSLTLRNIPYPENPKTGHLVVMSLIKAIRRLDDNFIVGF
jgi:aspartate dehydrogenase